MQAQEITLMHVCFLTFKFHLLFVNEALFLVNKEQAACLKRSGTGLSTHIFTNAEENKKTHINNQVARGARKNRKIDFFVCLFFYYVYTKSCVLCLLGTDQYAACQSRLLSEALFLPAFKECSGLVQFKELNVKSLIK